MDVRMLGSGRTFILQLGDARSLRPLLDSSILVNFSIDTGDVQVNGGLRHVDKGVLDWLHWSTEQHLKVYRCIVWSAECFPSNIDSVLAAVKNLKVFQRTPLRVLHRRSDNTREKYIHAIRMEMLNPHFGIVTLHASAGAYIKEFIHGDFGRTKPSFSDVVFGKQTKCDILQLDVLEVEQDDDEAYVPLWER
jgi:tRNA pseudouridine synthase 10